MVQLHTDSLGIGSGPSLDGGGQRSSDTSYEPDSFAEAFRGELELQDLGPRTSSYPPTLDSKSVGFLAQLALAARGDAGTRGFAQTEGTGASFAKPHSMFLGIPEQGPAPAAGVRPSSGVAAEPQRSARAGNASDPENLPGAIHSRTFSTEDRRQLHFKSGLPRSPVPIPNGNSRSPFDRMATATGGVPPFPEAKNRRSVNEPAPSSSSVDRGLDRQPKSSAPRARIPAGTEAILSTSSRGPHLDVALMQPHASSSDNAAVGAKGQRTSQPDGRISTQQTQGNVIALVDEPAPSKRMPATCLPFDSHFESLGRSTSGEGADASSALREHGSPATGPRAPALLGQTEKPNSSNLANGWPAETRAGGVANRKSVSDPVHGPCKPCLESDLQLSSRVPETAPASDQRVPREHGRKTAAGLDAILTVREGAARSLENAFAKPPLQEGQPRQLEPAQGNTQGTAPRETSTAPVGPSALVRPAATNALSVEQGYLFDERPLANDHTRAGASPEPLGTDSTSSPLRVSDLAPARSEMPLAHQRADLARHATEQLSQAVRRSHDGSLEVQLSPEELGKVRLVMSGNESSLQVSIVVERSETLELIRRHIDILARDFREQGYASVGFTFDQQGGRSDTGNSSGGAAEDRVPLEPDFTGSTRPEERLVTHRDGLDLRL